MLNFLPYALAAYGGYKGYQSSKQAGGSGIQRILGGATGAAMGYYGGKTIVGNPTVQSMFPSATKFTPFQQTSFFQGIPFLQGSAKVAPATQQIAGTMDPGMATQTMADFARKEGGTGPDGRTLLEKLFYKKKHKQRNR